jgi:hypothetical protein
MNKALKKLVNIYLFWFDYIIGYMMTSQRMLPYYHRYMYEKYGTRYCSQAQFEEYWNSIDDDGEPTAGYVRQE